MSTITLYRIKIAPFPKNYRVSQAYRIHTEKTIQVPANYALEGVHVPQDHAPWVEHDVIPVIEQHNGDLIIEKWAVPLMQDPEHITIAIAVNNVLIAPDMLSNTTYWGDRPKTHKSILVSIYNAICETEQHDIVLPEICPKWALETETKVISDMLRYTL